MVCFCIETIYPGISMPYTMGDFLIRNVNVSLTDLATIRGVVWYELALMVWYELVLMVYEVVQ
jgi:hypothetical protein